MPVVIWSKRGKYFEKALTNGMPFLVHSCTQPKTYQDNKARTMYVNECIVIKIELLGKKFK